MALFSGSTDETAQAGACLLADALVSLRALEMASERPKRRVFLLRPGI